MSSIDNNVFYSIIKKCFDEIDEVILKSHERDNSQTIPNVEDNYDDVTHDQRDKSIVNLVDVTADDELLLCISDGVVNNKKYENDNVSSTADLPSQEKMISDLSDDESSPKKSKQFTFTDSDLPDSEEIEEFLKAYPRHQVTFFPWIQSESKSYSDEKSNWFSRRRRKKMKPVTKITIEKLPERFMTRQRKPNIYLVTKEDCYRVLQSIYLKKQEGQTDEEIIRENIKRLKISNKNKIPESKHNKSKSFAINNITTIRRTRYMKNKGNGKNNKDKSMSSGNYKKEGPILPTVKERRSKRNQKTKQKDEDTMKVPVSVPKSEVKNNTNKSMSSGNDKKYFIRKRASARFRIKYFFLSGKERSTLPSVEGGRSKRNQKPKEKDKDAMKTPVSVPKSEDKNNKNKSISGNDKNEFKRKRALKKERSTLPAVEERRSKRNQKTKEKDEDTMKAPVSAPKSEDKNNTKKSMSSGNDKNEFKRKRALKKERSTLPAVEERRSKRNQKTKEKDEDTMKTPASVPKSEDKNNKNKSITSGNDKNYFIRNRAFKKERSTLPAVEERRINRYQKTIVKETMKAPVSIPKKRVHEERTVYNISSSSSESSKGLKRSLVEDIDVPSPKQTGSHNNKITNAPTSATPTEKIRGLEPDKRVRNGPARRGRKAA